MKIRSNFRKFLCVIFLVFSVCRLSAENDIISARTAVCRFQYKNNEGSNLSYGLSLKFFEAVKTLPERRVESDEIAAILADEKADDAAEKTVELEKLYNARDKLLFSSDSALYDKKIEEKEIQIEKAVKELELLKNEADTSGKELDFDAYSEIGIEIIKPDEGFIFEREPGAIRETAEKYDLDLIVYGSIEDLDQYQLIEVRVWNNLLGKDVLLWRTAVSPEEISEMIAPGIVEVKTAVLGRKWAELSVEAPENSLIYIDDHFSGIGRLRRQLTEPGEHLISVRKRGLQDYERTVTIEEFMHETITVELEDPEGKPLIIQTFPQGADVYLDSQWQGKSPLRLEITELPSAVRIKKEGYDEINFFADGTENNVENYYLSPDVRGREESVSDSRRRFYRSFGAAVLSIPVTALFWSLNEETATAYKLNLSGSYDELVRLEEINKAQYSFYIASLGLNIFLVLDTIFKAVEYVDSVEYFSR